MQKAQTGGCWHQSHVRLFPLYPPTPQPDLPEGFQPTWNTPAQCIRNPLPPGYAHSPEPSPFWGLTYEEYTIALFPSEGRESSNRGGKRAICLLSPSTLSWKSTTHTFKRQLEEGKGQEK